MEAYNLPVKLREWFVNRLMRQKKEENEAVEAANKGGGGSSAPTTLGRGNAPPSTPLPSSVKPRK